jgi:hypothetical protein
MFHGFALQQSGSAGAPTLVTFAVRNGDGPIRLGQCSFGAARGRGRRELGRLDAATGGRRRRRPGDRHGPAAFVGP